MLSFSQTIKQELLKVETKKECCKEALLCALVSFLGEIKYEGGKAALFVKTENEGIVKLVERLLFEVFGIREDRYKLVKRKERFYIIIDDEDVLDILIDGFNFKDEEFEDLIVFNTDPKIISSLCCKKALVRGAFLAAGSINPPEKNYHFEIVIKHFLLEEGLISCFTAFDLHPKTIMRKSSKVMYFKDGDEIADCLNLMGAHNSLMDYLNTRIIKEQRNNINRQVNCETANITKTIDASIKHVESIEKIKNTIGLENLPENLYEIAKLRLEEPEASLKDLGQMLHPPISKSGVNHRLKKIMEIAKDIK